ncbi:MAG TPA: 2-oxo acid dehydrogenase subunit E2 [Candidatus Thalassarchaeaceae archaeon]|jgi:2-oxoisovalerate dehydrogenase E2 component (dihydrolipoyl transacylase)|nr:branched-chain alpha-keto acid dehydrogenase subunit E2 [Euryarchaeota archaeon]DAC45147.1 MAG TPA: 2-oxo acid dehydrogenase subunit E2 [Candidatus Poseidoniales archaeon]HII34495.1 2-oxo acid dehydrogenase subunit E2 [Candidatus Thalassarchaeaceae archaeon]|tara:strand:- start:4831 stop:6117 length:1287 start_codon:yes stop_codon:yes gene_type:complete
MAKYDFKLPDIGEGVVEGEVVTWHVSVGDTVSEDDPIVDVMTDKATVTIPSPTDGTVLSLNGEVGDMVAVGSVLIEFDTDGSAPSVPEDKDESGPVVEEVRVEKEEVPIETEVREAVKLPEVSKPIQIPVPELPTSSSRTVLASPAVRRRAREANIDLASLNGSGPAGRVRHADIDAFVAGGGAVMGAPPVAYSTKKSGISEVKIVGLRRKISEQMVKSAFSIPHFSYFEEVDVTELEALRQALNASRGEDQPKLTYLPFIMLALAKIMPDHPECNGYFYDGDGVVHRHEAVNLGIATQTDRGLFVPVVKNVEAMDVWHAASDLIRVSGAARAGTASLDDLTGSTFTITSLGRDGGLGATPIINHPEMAILGVHKAREMPVVRSGNIVIRRMMNLSSSFDHRVIDGADGAQLVQHLKKMLEHPAMIFM